MNRLERLHSLTDHLRKFGSSASGTAQPSAEGRGWATRRGEIRVSLECDVIGNFPGFHRSAALIVGARTLVTSAYLVVDEGEPHGFALPLTAIADISLDDGAHAGPDLIVRYRQDGDSGWFRLRESRGRLRRKGAKGIGTLRAALREGHVSFDDIAGGFNAYLLVPWEAAASLETEPEIWGGRLTAPIRATLECGPAHVWMSPSSLVWGSGKGEGVNRLQLTAIRSLTPLTLADPSATPAVFISTFGPDNTPVSLPFIFDSGADRASMRDEFVGLFSPTLVGDIDASPPFQPWYDPEPEEVEDEPDVFDELAEVSESLANEEESVEAPDEPEDETEQTPAWETWASARPPSRFGIESSESTLRAPGGTIPEPMKFDSSEMRLAEALAVWPGTSSPAPEPDPEEPAPLEPTAISTYLAAAHKAIDEVNDVIDRRIAGNSAPSPRAIPPSTADQAAALAELVELTSSGYYDAEATRSVKAKITRFGEAAVRVRSLLELCNAGHMTIKEVGAKRDAIMAGLPRDEEN